MKEKRNLKLLIAITAAVFLTVSLFIMTGYFFLGQENELSELYSQKFARASDQTGSEILQPIGRPSNSNVESVEESDLVEGEESVAQEAEEEQYISQGVYSSINLKFLDQVYIINTSDVELMLGHSTNLEDARKNFAKFGEKGIMTVVTEAFDGSDFDKKIYQQNKNGINKDIIMGFEYYENKYGPDYSDAVEEVQRVMETRLDLNTGNQDYVKVKRVYHPGTNGEYALGKYVELDQSEQTIYAWEDGVMYKKWLVSGFYDSDAVYGVFNLINKSPNAWSPGAQKWMPYWMAFYYSNNKQAWYGLHSLVYWYDEQGNKIEESNENIGIKKSHGCIRLDRGEIEELYNWVDIGIQFLIHE